MPKWGGGGKIEGRHILIIAMSEHHVDYMNRKDGHSVIMQGGPFHRCDSCMAPGFWQTMISMLRLGRNIIQK